ncbi:MAG: YmdB family metallophosphoesterase [Gemmatimonadetes bacterium]|nr:YmdB family metallophosphoesterase [Gemmatimonadota bacterium]MBT7860434.1 YmdB family metallophosphoesterase [Gemmatimonadota bacterium]
MRILFVADIYARPGRRAAAEIIPRLILERDVDLCVANGENAAGGFGMTDNIVRKLRAYGVDVVTSGNHVWNRADFARRLDAAEHVLRPLNYPDGAPGRGKTIVEARDGTRVGVVNLQGRTFMPAIDCPFVGGAKAVAELREETPVILVDFHAEATAEKIALGYHLDGQASAVLGTHTHIQTADERLLPGGTAYLTDAGMTGVQESVIGTRAEIAVQRFIDGVPARFKPADGIPTLCGALVDIDTVTGRANAIERLQIRVEEDANSQPDPASTDLGDED